MDMIAIAAKLVALRTKKGDTIAQAAKAMNISTSALGMYETGKRVPRDEVKVALASYYGVSIEDLFFAS